MNAVALLQVRDLIKDFGGSRVINRLEMNVHEGEILGLIGPNGAGKTTLFNVISGSFPPTKGKVIFGAEDITGLKPHVIARKGIVRTFQLTNLWYDFNVMDNMRLALHMKSGVGIFGDLFRTPSTKKKEQIVDQRAMEILKAMGMDHLKDQVARTLSHGYQKTLSLAIGMATSPRLLLLDEPLAALNPERRKYILDSIRRLRDAGVTIIIIEHDITAVFNLCDRIIVLNHGSKIAEGTPSEVREDPDVISAYLGVRKGVA